MNNRTNPHAAQRLARICLVIGLGTLCGGSGSQAAAQEATGGLVRLKLPLEGAGDQVMQRVMQRTANKLVREARGRARPVLAIEFVQPEADSHGDFERCLSLARFVLRDMTGVKTVAYLPHDLHGHAVLIAIACEEIAISPDAQIGNAAAGEDPSRPVEPELVSVYREIAEQRRNLPPAVAAAMVDRRLELLKVEDESGIDFILSEDLPEREAQHAIASSEVITAEGDLASLTGREAREYGFAKYLVSGRDALARVLGVPAQALREDQATIAEWKPVVIDIQGAITPRVVRQVTTLIGSETRGGKSNWIGFRIDSGGGPIESCLELAQIIAELDSDDVRTVAYVPVEASGGAALVALACDQLVVHPEAKIGGGLQLAAPARDQPGRLPPKQPPGGPKRKPRDDSRLTREQIDAARTAIENSLGAASGREWSLLAAAVDPELPVFRYTHRKSGEQALFSEAEAASQPDAANWKQGEELTVAGQVLVISGQRAADLNVALHAVNSFDELKQLYGFTADPPLAKPNWALELVEALANPWLAGVLLLIGFVGIYIELNTPGLGVGGFVSTVAFLLFFWSHFLSGAAEWLEVLLFLVGLFFILMEVFVLPGFGIFGLGGIAMVLGSLVLVSQTFVIPQSEGQLVQLRQSLTMVVGAMVGCLLVGFALRQYLPHAPGIRRMILPPPSEVELAEQDHRESLADYTHLIGKTGETTTDLMPGGRAEIEGEMIDVIADGLLIDRGQKVVVVSARGSRVMVKKV